MSPTCRTISLIVVTFVQQCRSAPPTTSSASVFASGTTSGSSHPFPDSLPLSTLPVPPPNRFSTPPSSRTPCPSFSRSSWPPNSLTMPPSGAIGHPHYLNLVGIVDPFSLSSPSVLSTADLPGPTTNTDARGTSLPLSSASSSNPGVSASLTSSLSWMIFSSSSQSLSANPTSVSKSTSTSPVAQTSSSSPVSSYLPHPTSSLFPSPSTSQFSTPFSTSATTQSPPDSTTIVVATTTLITSLGPLSSSPPSSPSTSTYTIISILLGQGGSTTDIFTSSMVLSTEPPGNALDSTLHISPGTIAAIVLGIVGAFAFAALWLFCARRRHRKLVQETTLVLPVTHAPGPLDDEILVAGELGYGTVDTHGTESLASQTSPTMEERYANILAALHLADKLGRGNEGGSTGGVYGSHRDIATVVDGDDDITRASSPTLPPHSLSSDDPSYPVLLSPPPPVSLLSYHQTTQPTPPPSAYYMSSRRKSSPGPDTATWLSGYSVAPSHSSHYARSQTLGSGSASASVDALTRTQTGSEEPLLGIGKVTSEITAGVSTPGGVSPTATDPGSNKLGLGSAFGSPAASMYMCSPSSLYPTLQHDSSGSYDVRTASRTGSYGYARSGTPSSLDILRSVSSQGALSSAYSHGQRPSQGLKLELSRPGSSSSAGNIGKKAGSGRHSFGVPPTSFRAWKDRGSTPSDKEKQSLKEKDGSEKTRSTSASNSESMDEKQGRGSPVVGVRALLGRLRLGGRRSSSRSSNKDLSSPTKSSIDADLEKAAASRMTPPPIEIQVATPQRRRFSFILSNPDPHPISPYSGAGNVVTSTDVSPHEELLPVHERTPIYDPYESKRVPFGSGTPQRATAFPTDRLMAIPSPAPTEESRLAEDLLHPRLRTQGNSDASLRDFEDYSRPIGGVVKNRLYSTTTFGTQDDVETRSQCRGTPVQDVAPSDEHENEDDVVDIFGATTPTGIPHDSWSFNDPPKSHHSP